MDIPNINSEDVKNAGELFNTAAKSFLGKKLLNSVGNYFNRRNGIRDRQKEFDSENEKIVLNAQAEVKADLIKFNAELEKGGLLADYIKKAGNTLISERIRKDFNLDSTISAAVDQLDHESSVSDKDNRENFSEDWFSRWSSVVEDVSDEEVQRVWASILAGEVKNPGSFSLRSLDVIRNLSKFEAEAFAKFANFIITAPGGLKFVFKKNMETLSIVDRAINLEEMRIIEEAGLVTPGSSTLFGGLQIRLFNNKTSGSVTAYQYGNLHVQVTLNSDISEEHQEGIMTLTRAGTELYNIISPIPDLDYIREIKDIYMSKNSNITMSVHDIVSRNKGQYSYKIAGTIV